MFDLRIHPETLSDIDIDTMLQFGIHRALLVGPHSADDVSADGLIEGFHSLLKQQLRLKKLGMRTWVALGVHPASLPKRGLPRVLDEIPKLCRPDTVRAIGSIGLFTSRGPQLEAFDAHLSLAETLRLPVLISLPVRRKDVAHRLTLERLKKLEMAPASICIDGNSTRTVRSVLSFGHHAGLTVHPEYLDVSAAVTLVKSIGASRVMLGSAAGHGATDILSLALTTHRLEKEGLSASLIRKVSKENAANWLAVAL